MDIREMKRKVTGTDNPVVKTGLITIAALAVAQLVLCYAAGEKGWAIAYLWSVASFAIGAMLGFLFGVPKVLQDETNKSGEYRQLVNTNLDQISDWLTKVVVGLSLVNAREILTSLRKAAGMFANALGNSDGSVALGMAVMIYFSVIGFMSIYILTRLYLSPAFSTGDQAYQLAKDSVVAARQAKTLEEAVPHLDKALGILSKGIAAAGASTEGSALHPEVRS
jgi:hypothetical protein